MKHASLGMTLVIMGLAAPVFSDTAPRLDPAVELQRQQQEQLIQRQIQAPRPVVEPEGPRGPSEPSSVICINVARVVIAGARVLSSETLRPVVAPFEGRCLTQADIGQLLQAINAAYVAKGYVTSRAYLPEQDAGAGDLQIIVIEGRVEELLLNDNQRSGDRRRLAFAFPTAKDAVLKLSDIEQGVDQLNRAPSAQAAVALEPGSQPGKSRVVVKTVDDQTWRAGLTMDNSGEKVTGEYKTTASLDKDNLLEVNDVWQLAASRTDDTRALSLNVSAPFGYWTLSGSYSESRYTNDLGGGLEATGDSHSGILNADYLFFRNQIHQLSVISAIATRESSRDVDGIALLPDGTSTVKLGLRWLRRDEQRTLFLQGAWVRGTDWFDAVDDPAGLPANFPHHQFDKLEIQGQFSTRLNERFIYSVQLQAQYAERALVGGEQLVLGGLGSVRGFNTSSAYGDKGVSLRNQVSTTCPLQYLPRLECQAFIDAGMARALIDPPFIHLVGGGLGARHAWRHAFGELLVATPLYASDRIKTDAVEVHFQIGARY